MVSRRRSPSSRRVVWPLTLLLPLLLLLAVQPGWAGRRTGRVRWVLDGDTVVLWSGEKIRYKGINAPEIAHKDQPGEPFGRRAAEFNRRLVEGKRVIILTRGRSRDRYGRTLAYLFLPDGTMVNERLLEVGLAHMMTMGRRVPFWSRFLAAQRRAMRERRGLWSLYYRMVGMRVVGNAKSMRFHRLDCPYGRSIWWRNRRPFRSVWEAFWNGYSPCKKCRPWPGRR